MRQLHGATKPFRQRQTRRRAQPKPSPSSPPLRLVSAYGSALHGYHRGPQAFFAEPLNSWLALLGDAVPFHKDCLVVCPSSMPEERVKALWQRAKAHIPAARVVVMKKEEGQPGCLIGAEGADSRQRLVQGRESSHALQDTTSPSPLPSSSSSAVALTNAGSASPAPVSPLRALPADSFDLIVFAGNVFADELFYDAPWHVSMAHRCLRPHGVLGVFGYDRAVSVSAPAWAAEDLSDFHAAMREDVERALVELRQGEGEGSGGGAAAAYLPTRRLEGLEERRARLAKHFERAREAHLSESVAHGDTYFPFLAVQRRSFVSEYAVDPGDVAACVRAQTCYQLLRQLERERELLGLGTALSSSSSSSSPLASAGEADEAGSDFVDTAATPPAASGGESAAATVGAVDGCALNVCRRSYPTDPLEALEGVWSTRLALEGGRHKPLSNRPSSPSAPLRLQVRHFVVTCSNRRMNTVI